MTETWKVTLDTPQQIVNVDVHVVVYKGQDVRTIVQGIFATPVEYKGVWYPSRMISSVRRAEVDGN